MSGYPVVRVAQQTDAAVLHFLYRQLVDDENAQVAESQIRSTSKDARTRLFVCEIDGSVEATGARMMASAEDSSPSSYLSLSVRPNQTFCLQD